MEPIRHTTDVFFVGFWPDYETYFLNAVESASHRFKLFNPKTQYSQSIGFNWLPRALQNKCYVLAVNKLLRQNPQALFIFQGDNKLLELLAAQTKLPRLAILMRNICQPNSKAADLLTQLQKKDILVFSFDAKNCTEQDYMLYQQFAEKVPHSPPPIEYDFYFIGRDKGRLPLLKHIQRETERLGYKTHIDIQGVKKTNAQRILSYPDYLTKQLNCHCIIDINRTGQHGLTLRPLEALLYGKKLLTNNQSIRNEALFHPNNIFIITDSTDYSELKQFMQSPYKKPSTQLINQYRTTPILLGIIERIESSHPIGEH